MIFECSSGGGDSHFRREEKTAHSGIMSDCAVHSEENKRNRNNSFFFVCTGRIMLSRGENANVWRGNSCNQAITPTAIPAGRAGVLSSMGLWPTHRDESALLRFIDSKRLTPGLSTECKRHCLLTPGCTKPLQSQCDRSLSPTPKLPALSGTLRFRHHIFSFWTETGQWWY